MMSLKKSSLSETTTNLGAEIPSTENPPLIKSSGSGLSGLSKIETTPSASSLTNLLPSVPSATAEGPLTAPEVQQETQTPPNSLNIVLQQEGYYYYCSSYYYFIIIIFSSSF
jgi:hypothetical protein